MRPQHLVLLVFCVLLFSGCEKKPATKVELTEVYTNNIFVRIEPAKLPTAVKVAEFSFGYAVYEVTIKGHDYLMNDPKGGMIHAQSCPCLKPVPVVWPPSVPFQQMPFVLTTNNYSDL